MSSTGVPTEVGRAMELGHVVNQGIRRSDPEVWATWISDPRTPELISQLIGLGPDRAILRLRSPLELETFITTKVRLLGLKLTASEIELAIHKVRVSGRSSYGFSVSCPQLRMTLEQFGIQFRSISLWTHQSQEVERLIDPGPTDYPFTPEEYYDDVRPMLNHSAEEQERIAARSGARVMYLIELLDFFLDVCIRGQALGLTLPQTLEPYEVLPGLDDAILELRCADRDATESKYLFQVRTLSSATYFIVNLGPGDAWRGYGALIRR